MHVRTQKYESDNGVKTIGEFLIIDHSRHFFFEQVHVYEHVHVGAYKSPFREKQMPGPMDQDFNLISTGA